MKIAIASPPIPKSLADGLHWLEKLTKDAAAEQAEIICFPESYLPGYPGMGYSEADRSPESLTAALEQAKTTAKQNDIALIVPMDRHEGGQLYNVACVISAEGEVLGWQTKNQLDPSEDEIWAPGKDRQVFEINGLKFGISICHEGFRYPETVRWAARNGAHVVFHPYFAGSDTEGTELSEWCNKSNPYYEKAQMVRAMENTIYFAGSNYASRYSEGASAIIAPDGTCLAHARYGESGIITADIETGNATAKLAKRFRPELYYKQ